jgi:phosphate transport system substrate-binding protein
MHSVATIIAMLLIVAAVPAQAEELRVGGSTTSLPIISNCAAHFMEKYSTWADADPALPKEPTIIYVTGGGSGFGIKGIGNGTIDVGMVARDLKENEIKELNGPLTKPFARDAVAIATSANNPLSKVKPNLSTEEIAALFSGKVESYAQIDNRLPDKTVVLLARDAGGGITEIFQQRVLKTERLSASRLQFPSTAGLIKKLETSDNAIAFVSAGAISQEAQVHVYAVDGVTPTEENIRSGKYELSRSLLLVAKANPVPRAQAFISFVLGPCQTTVKELGFIPVGPAQ